MKKKFEVSHDYLRELWKDGGREVNSNCRYYVVTYEDGTSKLIEKLSLLSILLGTIPFIFIAIIYLLIAFCEFIGDIINSNKICSQSLIAFPNKFILRSDYIEKDDDIEFYKKGKKS